MLPLLALLVALTITVAGADQGSSCLLPPLPVLAPTHADAVYFIFVIDNSWPVHKIAQQKALYRMMACSIPRSKKFLVGTVYAYAPKRSRDYVFDDKSLATSDRFDSTLDDAVEQSYASRPPLPYDGTRCSRMHAVVEVMRMADFSYDSTVHSHYIFPTDDSEDDFVNDCDPAWTFKQTARNIFNPSPNHLYLDVVRVGAARRWTQYGERLQLEDWSDRSINQKDISFLTRDFLEAALTGSAVNDVIVFATNGLKRSERPKGIMSLMTDPPTTPPPTTTTVTPSTTVPSTTTVTTTTAPPTTTHRTTTVPVTTTTSASAAPAATTAVPTDPEAPTVRKSSRRKAATGGNDGEGEDGLSIESFKLRQRRNITGEGSDLKKPTKEKKSEIFGFSPTIFYIIVAATTVGVVLLVWATCALVFYCCYRDDDAIKKHNQKEAEEEDEMMLISGLSENAWERPSSMMVSDHLRKVKEDRYNEEQLKSVDARGTISIE